MRNGLAAFMVVVMAAPSVAQTVAAASVPVPSPPAALVVPAVPAPSANEITIPANTEIWLTPLRDISSKHVHQGDAITMQVSRNVFVHRVLVIPRGAEATGKISYRTGKGALGKSAKIEFDLATLTVAHHPVPIAGHYRVAGDGNSAWAVATFLLVSMVGSLFITGHSAVVPAGSEWRAATAAPLQIALDDESLPPTAAATFRRATYRTASAPAGVTSEYDIPANSAYVPAPSEILVRTLPGNR